MLASASPVVGFKVFTITQPKDSFKAFDIGPAASRLCLMGKPITVKVVRKKPLLLHSPTALPAVAHGSWAWVRNQLPFLGTGGLC